MTKTASGVVAGLAALLLLACSAPDAGSFTGAGAGGDDDDDDDDSSAQGSSGISGAPGPSTPSTKSSSMSATLKGAGTGAIASTPSGLTCTGTTCTGNFAPGTAVTLTAKATAGSLFLGWGGGCTGAAACAVVVNGPVAIDAEFALLAGSTWTGSYTGQKKVGGCVANNSGTLTMRLTQSGGLLSSKVVLTGIDLRDTHSCHTAGTTGGLSADAPTTLTGQTLSGTWTVAATGPTPTFSYPFAATIVGKTMIGRWTCTDCTGEFSLTTP